MASDPEAVFAAGMEQLDQQDFVEALRLFTEVVDSPAASPSLQAAARNYRATICLISGGAMAAANEWGVVLATEGLPAEDYAAARDGLSHLAGVAEQPAGTVTPEALHQHGLFHLKVEEFGVAIAAFTLVAHDPRASGDQRANALSHRGFTHLKADNALAAASDWSRVPEIAGASEMTLLLARRGLERIAGGRALRKAEEQWQAGDIPAAIATYQSVMESTGGNGMDQFVAAGALLKLEGVPEAVRAQAEQYRARMLSSPRDKSASSGSPGLLVNVLAFGIMILLHSVLGIILGAVLFSPIAIVGFLATGDWSAAGAPLFFGAVIGFPVGVGIALKSWFGDVTLRLPGSRADRRAPA